MNEMKYSVCLLLLSGFLSLSVNVNAVDLVAENLEDGGEVLGDAGYNTDAIFGDTFQIADHDDAIVYEPASEISAVDGDYALAFWFKPTQGFTGVSRSLTFKGYDENSQNFAISLHPDNNQIQYRITTTTSSDVVGNSASELTIGEWHHIAYVHQNNTLSLYINGRLDSIIAINGEPIANDGPLYIGHSPNYPIPALGEFAEVNLYQRTLSRLEIRSLYKEKFLGRNMEEQGIALGSPVLLDSTDGREGLALSLDSTDDGIRLPNSIITKPETNDWSVAMWLRFDDEPVDEWRSILHKGSSDADRDFSLWRVPGSNRLNFGLTLDNNPYANLSSNTSLVVGQWHHIVLAKIGSRLRLYIDGVRDSQFFFSGGVSVFDDGPLYVGRSPWNNAAVATIDELAIYNYALYGRDLPLLMNHQLGNAPADVGEWGNVIAWPQVPVSMANLPDGRILSWSGSERTTWPTDEQTYSSVWDPVSGEFDELYHDGHNMFCAHLAMTEDGEVFVNGGRNNVNSPWTSLFNYKDNQWTQIENMASGGRWYPTTNALPTGEIITSMGTASNLRNPEKWSPENSWQVLNGVDFVDMRQTNNGATGQGRWWPILTVAPNGNLFHYWNESDNHFIDTEGTGAFTPANADVDVDQATGVAIQYGAGKLLMTGGNQGSRELHGNNERAYTIDLGGAVPLVRQTQEMLAKRTYHNLVSLPNGEVLAVGGSGYDGNFNNISSVYRPEIWNPESGQWRLMARGGVPRNYHSTALLLADGRVLSAGGGYRSSDEFLDGATHQNGQIFSPPYLFAADGSLATRPEITNAPGVIRAGESFNVWASSHTTRFSMIRMSATTHAVNTDSRFLWLETQSDGNGIFTLTPDANPNVLMPGYWMVFALDANDVPSKAHIVRVDRSEAVITPGVNRYVKFIAQSEVNDGPWTSIAELNILDGAGSLIDRSNWQVNVNSYESVTNNFSGENAIDGDPASIWQTELNPAAGSHPNEIVVDLGADYSLSALQYLPRQDSADGRIKDYTVQISANGIDWIEVAQGTLEDGITEHTISLGSDTRSTAVIQSNPSATDAEQSFTVDSDEGLEYQWTWGDGSQTDWLTETTASHAFSAPGRYVVVVTTRNPITGQQTQTSFVHIVFDDAIDLDNPNRWLASSAIAYHPSLAQVWNVNPDNNTVTVIDSQSFNKLSEISVGEHPSTLAFDGSGRVWVVNRESGSISVINPQSFTLETTIELPNLKTLPHGILIPRIAAEGVPVISGSALITLEATNEVLRIDLDSLAVEATIPSVSNPRYLAHNPYNSEFYVSAFITPSLPDESGTNPDVSAGVQAVQVADLTTMETTTALNMQYSDRERTENSGPGLPNYLGSMAVHPNGLRAYVPSKQDNILGGVNRVNGALTFDQTVRAISSELVLDGVQSTENVAARIEHDNASVATAAVYGPYGIHLFTALEGNRQVAVSLPENNAEISRIDVGFAPQGLALSLDGKTLAVHNFLSRSVAFIDISNIVDAGGLITQTLAEVSTVGAELLPADILKGKQLFYDAKDDRLAALDYMSCASCHDDGGHDGRVWDFTQFGEGMRNTISLRGKSGMGHGFLHWTANFDELQDFEGQIRSFAGGSGLMETTDFLEGTRSDPLGDTKAGLSSDLDALAAYMTSLGEADVSSMQLDNGLSLEAELGQQLFTQTGCAACHSNDVFTDSNGTLLHDVGTISAASGNAMGGILEGFDTPTLLGLASSAPYLHDGSAPSLEQAIAAHTNVSLSSDELQSLAQYLLELPVNEPPAPIAQVGRVSFVQSNSDYWHEVVFDKEFDELPVVTLGAASFNGAHPMTLRVRNVTTKGFELQMDEWDYLDGAHFQEDVDYFAVVPGQHDLGGLGVEAFTADMNSDWVSFSSDLASNDVVVFAQIATDNDKQAAHTRIQVGIGTFDIRIDEEEANDRIHADEQVHIIVIESGHGTINDQSFWVGNSGNTVDENWEVLPFPETVADPLFISGMQTTNGRDPATVRYRNLSGDQAEVHIDEETSANSEVGHVNEVVGYMVVEQQ